MDNSLESQASIMGNEMSACFDSENLDARNREKRRYRGTVKMPRQAGKYVKDREDTYERFNVADFSPVLRRELMQFVPNGPDQMSEDIKIIVGDIFKTTFPFSILGSDARDKILMKMTRKKTTKGQKIIEKGRQNEYCHVVLKGEFEEQGDHHAKTFRRPQDTKDGIGASCFGQLNMIHGEKESLTTVVCTTDEGELWCLKSDIYVQILSQVAKYAGIQRKRILAKVKFFTHTLNLSNEQVSHLSLAVDRVKFVEGQQIITKGEVGNDFYIVVKGKAEATEAGENNGTQVYNESDTFGEQALVNADGVRQANVKALTHTELFVLHRDDFANLLGPYTKFIEEQHMRTVLTQLLKTSSVPEIQSIANRGTSQLRALTERFELKTFKNNEIILPAGAKEQWFYVVSKGAVIVKLNNETIETIVGAEGDAYFGNIAILQGKREVRPKNSFHALAEDTECACFGITHSAFHEVIKSFQDDEVKFLNGFGTLQALEREQIRENKHPSSIPWCGGARIDGDGVGGSIIEGSDRSKGDVFMRSTTDGDSFEKNFDLLKQIGRGMLGQVFLVKHKSTQVNYAMKCMSKATIVETNQIDNVNSELRFLTSLNHPFVLQAKAYFQDDCCLFAIMDFLPGGELYRRRQKNFPHMEIGGIRFYSASVLDALDFLHSHNIIYRDLKPENIMIGSDGYIKMIDLGFAKVLKPGSRTYTFLGTPDYMSPEIVRRMGYGNSADYWALGVLIYEKLFGFSLFSNMGKERSHLQIFENIINYTDAKKKKLTSKGVAEYPDAVDIILQLTKVREAARLGAGRGARAVKEHPFFQSIDFMALRTKQHKPAVDIWVPETEEEDGTKNFKANIRYDPPVEFEGDESWCSHW